MKEVKFTLRNEKNARPSIAVQRENYYSKNEQDALNKNDMSLLLNCKRLRQR